jgi:hypothetical protein
MNSKDWRRKFSNNAKYSRLKIAHAEYIRELSTSGPAALVNTMCAELLKVSYIREIKTHRLKAFAWALLACVLLFLSLVTGDAIWPIKRANDPVQVSPIEIKGPVAVESLPPLNETQTQLPPLLRKETPRTRRASTRLTRQR